MIEGVRPERVLVKSEYQEVICPHCGKVHQVSAGKTMLTCNCGQVVNWGLNK